MTLLELVENYGPIVFANSELGIVIQRNGAYLNWGVERRDGWEHVDCRSVSRDSYSVTLAEAMDSAEEWFKEVMEENEEEDDSGNEGGVNAEHHVDGSRYDESDDAEAALYPTGWHDDPKWDD